MYTDTLSEHCWKINPNIYLVSRYIISCESESCETSEQCVMKNVSFANNLSPGFRL